MHTLSLAEISNLRSQASDQIRERTTAIDDIATALADVDAAMTSCIDEKNIDAMQGLVTAARLLSDAMDGGAV